MSDNAPSNKLKSVNSSSPIQITKSVTVTYVPIFLISINILLIHDVILGIISTTALLIFNGHVVYEKLKFLLGEMRWIGIPLGAFIFLLGLCVTSSPFVIFFTFPPQYIVATILISGIPMVLFRIRNKLPINPFTFPKKELIIKKENAILIALWTSLLFITALILYLARTTDSTFLWTTVPRIYIYLLFFFLAVTVFLLFKNINISVKIVITVISIIFVCLPPVFIVPTVYSPDTWFLLGETNGALIVDKPHQIANMLGQGPQTSIGSLSFSQGLVTAWSRGISNSLALYSSQLFQDSSLLFWRLLAPLFAVGTTSIILFRIGHMISKNYLYSLLITISFVFYSGLIYYMSNTVKTSLSVPFLILGLLCWINYISRKDKKSFLLATIITALNFLSYSLFFLILIDVMFLSILIRYVNTMGLKIRLLSSTVSVILLSFLIPAAQTLLGSSFTIGTFESQLHNISNWSSTLFGYVLIPG